MYQRNQIIREIYRYERLNENYKREYYKKVKIKNTYVMFLSLFFILIIFLNFEELKDFRAFFELNNQTALFTFFFVIMLIIHSWIFFFRVSSNQPKSVTHLSDNELDKKLFDLKDQLDRTIYRSIRSTANYLALASTLLIIFLFKTFKTYFIDGVENFNWDDFRHPDVPAGILIFFLFAIVFGNLIKGTFRRPEKIKIEVTTIDKIKSAYIDNLTISNFNPENTK